MIKAVTKHWVFLSIFALSALWAFNGKPSESQVAYQDRAVALAIAKANTTLREREIAAMEEANNLERWRYRQNCEMNTKLNLPSTSSCQELLSKKGARNV